MASQGRAIVPPAPELLVPLPPVPPLVLVLPDELDAEPVAPPAPVAPVVPAAPAPSPVSPVQAPKSGPSKKAAAGIKTQEKRLKEKEFTVASLQSAECSAHKSKNMH